MLQTGVIAEHAAALVHPAPTAASLASMRLPSPPTAASSNVSV
jgi:hypothetical protein